MKRRLICGMVFMLLLSMSVQGQDEGKVFWNDFEVGDSMSWEIQELEYAPWITERCAEVDVECEFDFPGVAGDIFDLTFSKDFDVEYNLTETETPGSAEYINFDINDEEQNVTELFGTSLFSLPTHFAIYGPDEGHLQIGLSVVLITPFVETNDTVYHMFEYMLRVGIVSPQVKLVETEEEFGTDFTADDNGTLRTVLQMRFEKETGILTTYDHQGDEMTLLITLKSSQLVEVAVGGFVGDGFYLIYSPILLMVTAIIYKKRHS